MNLIRDAAADTMIFHSLFLAAFLLYYVQPKSCRRVLVRHSKSRLFLIDFINIRFYEKQSLSVPEEQQEIKKNLINHFLVIFFVR